MKSLRSNFFNVFLNKNDKIYHFNFQLNFTSSFYEKTEKIIINAMSKNKDLSSNERRPDLKPNGAP